MCHFDDIARTLGMLEIVQPHERLDQLIQAALETAGEFHLPQPENSWDDQEIWLRAHGIYASGRGPADVVRNWIQVARRQVEMRARLRAAEYLLRQPSQATDAAALRDACQTVLELSADAAMLDAARRLIAQMPPVPTRAGPVRQAAGV